MPPSAIVTFEKMGMSPDTPYALDLLQTRAYVSFLPASGFGQKQGRYGFRTTFLLPESASFVDRVRDHYEQ